MENDHDSPWVAGRLAMLSPTWTSNVARARALVDVRTSATRRISLHQLLAVAGTVALIIAAVTPSGPRTGAGTLVSLVDHARRRGAPGPVARATRHEHSY